MKPSTGIITEMTLDILVDLINLQILPDREVVPQFLPEAAL